MILDELDVELEPFTLYKLSQYFQRKEQNGTRVAFDRELLRTLKKQAKRANITYE